MTFTQKHNCGNSPKMALLVAFNRAFATGDIEQLLEYVHSDFVWIRIGGESIQGIEAFKNALKAMDASNIISYNLDTVVSHGKFGAVNGSIETTAGNYAFADFYTFSNAKGQQIKELTSYIISL